MCADADSPGDAAPVADASLPVVDLAARYDMLDEHARGGMAKIFLVYDRITGRNVALKQLAPIGGFTPGNTPSGSKAGPAGYNRFIREARITAQLQHPGTIPVYEIGQDADGVPFYTMKFLHGRTLRKAVGTADSLPERLALLPHFVDLCNAVAYAHNNDVVHRDLKPDNIMVGEFGETVVLDWGIAKLLHAPDDRATDRPRIGADTATDQTNAEDLLGTPHYMAPEQADSTVGPVDARTDIYALGAVLYHILTGATPYAAYRVDDLLLQVAEGKVRPVRSIEREAPPELAAVCERAMARLPQNRYQSAKDLADEVTRYMTGGRVGAYPYSRGELMGRFLRRNRAMVRLVSVGALVLLAFAVWSYVEVVDRHTQALIARDEAEGQRQLALQHQQQADRNFRAARGAVEDFFTEVAGNELMETPGAEHVRRTLLTRALEYYQSFIGEYQDDPEFQLELADAYANVGRINDELGDQRSALPAIAAAQTILDRLANEHPDEPEYQYRLAKVTRDAAWVNYLTGNAREGFAQAQRSVALRQDLVDRFPGNPRYLALLADGLYEIADVAEITGDDAMAVQLVEQALGIYTSLVEADPSIEHRTHVARTHRRLGDFYQRVNRLDDALASCEASVALHRELLTEAPESRERQFETALAFGSLGGIQAVMNVPEAETVLLESIELFADLREQFPGVEKYQYEQSVVYRQLSEVPNARGDFRQSAEYLGQSTGLLRDLLAGNPENLAYRLQFAIQLTRRMDALRRDGRYLEAEIDGLEAIEFARSFAERNPEATDGRARLIEAMMNLALVYLESGKTGSYLTLHEQMLPLRGVDSATLDLPESYRVTAEWMLSTPVPRYRDPAMAAAFVEDAIQMEGPSVASLELLARVHGAAGDAEAAIEALAFALEIAQDDEKPRLEERLEEFRAGTAP